MKILPSQSFVVGLLAVSMLTGCGTTKPARFYTLSPVSQKPPAPQTEAARSITLGVGPISLPQYLDRPQIVTRAGPHRFNIAEFDRWGGSLKDDFGRVLADSLSALIPTEQVLVHPWRRTNKVDYQITIGVNRFDGELGNESVLNVYWRILTGDGKTVAVARRSAFSEPTVGSGYEHLVAAQSKSVGDLSRLIADAIKRLQQRPQSTSQ